MDTLTKEELEYMVELMKLQIKRMESDDEYADVTMDVSIVRKLQERINKLSFPRLKKYE